MFASRRVQHAARVTPLWPSYAGAVVVTVCRGEALKNVAAWGTADPCVELWVSEGHRARTRVRHDDLSPAWMETFELPVTDSGAETLHIKVLHEALLTWRTVGMASVPASIVPSTHEAPLRLKLRPTFERRGAEAGEELGCVELKVIFREYSEEESKRVADFERRRDPSRFDTCLSAEEGARARERALVCRRRK